MIKRAAGRVLRILGETFDNWFRHGAMTQGAALAFYSLISLAPVLVILVSVATVSFDRAEVRSGVVRQLRTFMGPRRAAALEEVLQNAIARRDARRAGALGIVVLLFGATAVFVQLQNSLNAVWEVRPEGSFFKRFIRKRAISFLLLLVLGALLFVSLAMDALLSGFDRLLAERFGLDVVALEYGNAAVSFALATVLFAMIYRILPDTEISWREVWMGAGLTALLLGGGRRLISLYLVRSAVGSVYGAAGSLVVIVFWVYYASLVVLLGAELTRVLSLRVLGRGAHDSPEAASGPEPAEAGEPRS